VRRFECRRTTQTRYSQSTERRLTLPILPCYAPDLHPDEWVWSHVKRTGVARAPLRKGERLQDRIEEQLACIKHCHVSSGHSSRHTKCRLNYRLVSNTRATN
jgi:transposase